MKWYRWYFHTRFDMDFTCRYTLLEKQEQEDQELKESDVDGQVGSGQVTHLKKAMSRLTIRMY